MTAFTLVLSQSDLDELARQEVDSVQPLGLRSNKKNSMLNEAGTFLERAVLDGLILFNWDCNPDGC